MTTQDTTESPTHISWRGMGERCRNPNHKYFAHYGGRGITVCRRWEFFENFVTDMGERPQGTSLDRIDNDGNYEPENCRWATLEEQRANRREPEGQPRTHCSEGHELTPENTRMHNRGRVCRTCASEYSREWRRQRAEQKA